MKHWIKCLVSNYLNLSRLILIIILCLSFNLSWSQENSNYQKHIENEDGTVSREQYRDGLLELRTNFKSAKFEYDRYSYRDYLVISEEWFDKDGNLFKSASSNDGMGNFDDEFQKYQKKDYLSCNTSSLGEIIISDKKVNASALQLLFDDAIDHYEGSGVCEVTTYKWSVNEGKHNIEYVGKGGCTNSQYFPIFHDGRLIITSEGEEIAYCHY